MSLPRETEAESVRLHFAEHWRVGTICTQLGLHPEQVERVLGFGKPRRPAQAPPARPLP